MADRTSCVLVVEARRRARQFVVLTFMASCVVACSRSADDGVDVYAPPATLARAITGQWSSTVDWESNEAESTEAIAFGDVDGDGDLDLAFGNRAAPNRLHENADGALSPAPAWSSDEVDDTHAVAFGDTDADGDLDLVVGSATQVNRVYYNWGMGLPTTATWSSVDAESTWAIALGDVDADGDLDMAVGNAGDLNRLYDNTLTGYGATSIWSADETPSTKTMAFGDMDGDGDLDLLAGNVSSGPSAVVYDNTGTTLGAVVWTGGSGQTGQLIPGDLNGDAALDLALAAMNGSNPVYSNTNTGAGLETTPSWQSADADGSYGVALGDANADGDVDVALGNDAQVSRAYENGAAGLDPVAVWSSLVADRTVAIAFADLDGDGYLELALGNDWSRKNGIYKRTEVGLELVSSWASSSGRSTSDVAFGDVDGDGDLDLALGNVAYFQTPDSNVLHDNTAAGLDPSPIWVSAETDDTRGIAFADIDADGDLDFATGNLNENDRIYLNTAGALEVSASWSTSALNGTVDVAFGDIDGDGDLDMAVATLSDFDRVYDNASGSIVTSSSWVSADVSPGSTIALGDMDGDGDVDLVGGRRVAVRRNDAGTLSSTITWTASASSSVKAVGFGDLDGDGDLDVASVSTGSVGGANLVYDNMGAEFNPSAIWVSLEVDDSWALDLGDINGDGDLDLVVGNRHHNDRIYVNDGGGLGVVAGWSSPDSDDTFGVAFGDIDGDGDLDLARGQASRVASLFKFQGASSFGLPNAPLAGQTFAGFIGNLDATGLATGMHSGTVLTSSPLTVPFTLIDAESNPVSRVELQYSYGGGAWFPGTLSDPLTDLATSPTGTSHNAQWIPSQDCMRGEDIYLRLRLVGEQRYDVPFPWQRGAIWIRSTSYRIRSSSGIDADSDGFPRCADCNPDASSCNTDCSDGDGDGHMDCLDRCYDVDGDEYGGDETRIVGSGTIAVQDCTTDGSTPCALQDTTCLGLDCDNSDGSVHPGVLDNTCDAVDSDCDGSADEDYVPDAGCGAGLCYALNTPSSCISGVEIACAPGTPPVSSEVSCTDLKDNDCDGLTDGADSDCTPGPCVDNDGDGFGDPGSANCPNGPAWDCNDGDATIKPGVDDSACNGVDDDCDTIIDSDYTVDLSCGIGHCRSANTPSSCVGGVETACVPGSPRSADDATCDLVDDNCNGNVDEDYVTSDACGWGYCRTFNIPSRCIGGVETLCQPSSPEEAPENSCNDAVDNDCDGLADGADSDCIGKICADADGDGFGTPGSAFCPGGPAADCDDSDAGIKPGADDSVCNGIDENCDTIVDGGYAVDASCGVGYCQATNTPSSCVAGTAVACLPGAPLDTLDTTCNAIDDDCDGFVDDDYVVVDTCGVGFCRSTNTASSCIAGAESSCIAGTPFSATDVTCNAVDDDCDGAADDDFPIDSSCGVGFCQTHNQPSSCTAGVAIACAPSPPEQIYEKSCSDGIDNDCDGTTDGADSDCGCVDADGDGYDTCDAVSSNDTDGLAADCDDSNNVVNPGRAENKNPTCTDAIDNDCDGAIDCSDADCTIPACSACPGDGDGDGYLNCGPTPDCDDSAASVHPGQLDTVCDGVDNDCDTQLDEDYFQDVTCGVGVCRGTTIASTCIAGTETACVPGTPTEVNESSCSDSLDNDCDGSADGGDSDCIPTCSDVDGDGYGNPGDPTCPGGGALDCDDSLASVRPGILDSTCDAVDDDCDGTADEDYIWDDSCGVGICYTLNTVSTCIAGVVTACIPGAPTEVPEANCADGIDNDCDGLTDGADGNCGGSCTDGDGDGYGNPGDPTCAKGAALDCDDTSASINPGMNDITCNGVDNNCSGAADDGYVANDSCGSGVCQTYNTASRCIAGVETLCIPGSQDEGSDLTCDGLDGDCDGLIDEDFVSDTSCGTGWCRDNNTPSRCVEGVEQACVADTSFSATDLTCNGIDDDCDGQVDEEYVVNASCGVGYCLAANTPSSCNAGSETQCVPGAPLGVTDATCDGVDDDCDGGADEDYVPSVSCGIGVCQTGSTPSSCSAGFETGCVAGLPGELPEQSCVDGFDNDCDGAADDADDDCSVTCSDIDGDSVCDAVDNCADQANTEQLDTDADALGNVCDADDDGDGMLDNVDPCPLVATTGPLAVPVAYVGPDKTADELGLVMLDGSSSCFPGSNSTFEWTQVAGPTVQVSDFNVAKLLFLAPRVFADTVLMFELVVADENGTSDPVRVSITVHNGINEAPAADAGGDQVVYAADVVALDASASSDANGDSLVALWSQVAGPTVAFDDDTAFTPSFFAPGLSVAQDVVLQVVVRDAYGATGVDAVVVTVVPTSGAPRFVSAPNLVGMVGDAYAYDGNRTLEVGGKQPMTFAVSVGPSEFNVNSEGVVAWIPQSAGLREIVVTASNDLGSAEQRFWVSVFATPMIVSAPDTSFLLGVAYRYDDNGLPEALGTTPLAWSLLAGPDDMFVNALTGEVVWTPGDSTPASVTLAVSNAHGSDQQSFVIARDGASPPQIDHTANGLGTLSVPYRYDADDHVNVLGTLPGERLRVEVLDAPEGFIVHPTSSEIGWVPGSLGAHDISLGLLTADHALLDRYDFVVTVASEGAALLRAVAAVTPHDGPAPVSAVFDASDSRGTDGLPILQYVWDTQSGPILRSAASDAAHVYERPGGYMAELEIWDTLGYFARDKVGVAVLDGPFWPPTARIEADTLQGDGELTVQFGCNCSDPDGEILTVLWQFGDGTTSTALAPEHFYKRPGNYTVRLTVEDDRGLLAYDSVTAVVTFNSLFPPVARVETTSIDGNGPVVLAFHADSEDRDGVVEFVQWTLPDGTLLASSDLVISIDAGEYYTVALEVVDNDGLSGFDERTIIVRRDEKRPPRIVSEPARLATVGLSYVYDADGLPSVQGDRPVLWSLGRVVEALRVHAPEGMVVNAQSGEITWTPTPQQVGTHRVTLHVDNAAGASAQDFVVTVRDAGAGPQDEPEPEGPHAAVTSGCACAGTSASWNWGPWVMLLLVWRGRERRKDLSAVPDRSK